MEAAAQTIPPPLGVYRTELAIPDAIVEGNDGLIVHLLESDKKPVQPTVSADVVVVLIR